MHTVEKATRKWSIRYTKIVTWRRGLGEETKEIISLVLFSP